MLADILYGLLLLVSALAVIGIFRHIRSLRRTSDIPSERLFILMFVLLVSVLLGYLFLNSQLNKLGVSASELEKTEVETFVERLYPPLYATQKQLNAQVLNLKDLQKQIVALRDEHPQQKDRLEYSYSVWNHERKGLVVLKSDLEKSIYKAWSYHRKFDRNFVENKFSQEAVDWDTAIKLRLVEYQGSQAQVTKAMLDNVIEQRQKLSDVVVGKIPFQLDDGVLLPSEFSATTIDQLLEVLSTRSPKQEFWLDSLNKQINFAAQKRREVRNHALDKPDLQVTFQRIRKDWLALENLGIFYRNEVLHAVQADYLAQLLGVNQRDNQLVRLERQIDKKLPALLADLKASIVKLDKSYQLSTR